MGAMKGGESRAGKTQTSATNNSMPVQRHTNNIKYYYYNNNNYIEEDGSFLTGYSVTKYITMVLLVPMILLVNWRMFEYFTSDFSAPPSVLQPPHSFLPEDFDCPPCPSVRNTACLPMDQSDCRRDDEECLNSLRKVELVDLSTSRPNQLKQVFFSGASWTVLCTHPENDHSRYERMLLEAASFVSISAPESQLSIGKINCSSILPSGKTIYERFQLDRSSTNNVIFAVAFGNKPIQAPTSYLEDSLKLGGWMRQRTRPRIWQVQDDSQLMQLCLKRKACVLITSDSLSTEEKDILLALQGMNPFKRVHFVFVNSTMYELSTNPSIPELVEIDHKDNDKFCLLFSKHTDAAKPPLTMKGDRKYRTLTSGLGIITYTNELRHPNFISFLNKVMKKDAELTTLKYTPKLKKRPEYALTDDTRNSPILSSDDAMDLTNEDDDGLDDEGVNDMSENVGDSSEDRSSTDGSSTNAQSNKRRRGRRKGKVKTQSKS